jgi:HTH-type transcriptional regulator/antitoxin HigA
MAMNNWTIIRTEEEYQKALDRLDSIFTPKTSREKDEFDLLVLLINNYEELNHHIEEADPIQVIKMKMDYMGLNQKDMIKYIGSKGTVSKILSYKSPLTLKHVWILSKILRLPVELLARPYKIESWNFMKKFKNLELKEKASA